MAAYETVTWQNGDEAVVQKFQQMCNNTDWLKENHVAANVNYYPNSQGTVADGRQASIVGAKRLEGVAYAYDSQVPNVFHEVVIPLPPVFTEAPIPSLCWSRTNQNLIAEIIAISTSEIRVVMVQRDGLSVRMQGTLYLHLLGV